ncbi:hypothetical protein [Streptomyces sp. ALB3]|uniref:hypothetical protein n=1 Tax=Streptomyces sp. ALB3 TaxID=3374278 RepID=UPI0037B4F365
MPEELAVRPAPAGRTARKVAAHYAEDPDDALGLYGTRLCAYAAGRAALSA